MINKKKLCAYHNRECFIYKSDGKDKYCKEGWYIVSGKAKGAIKKFSDKRSMDNKVYFKIRTSYLNTHLYCEAKISDSCSFSSTDIHHKAGRTGELLTNITNFLAVCRNCHRWIEEHPEKSKEFGFSLNRL